MLGLTDMKTEGY